MIETASTVLLVEDNPDDEELTIRGFKLANLQNPIEVARDGQEAIDYLLGTEEQAARALPVLVLLDLKLPRIDGFEVLERIRENERTRRLPVVILTSSNEDHDLADCYDLGANSYVRKPIEFTEFASTVARLSIYWLMVNEPAPTAGQYTR